MLIQKAIVTVCHHCDCLFDSREVAGSVLVDLTEEVGGRSYFFAVLEFHDGMITASPQGGLATEQGGYEIPTRTADPTSPSFLQTLRTWKRMAIEA